MGQILIETEIETNNMVDMDVLQLGDGVYIVTLIQDGFTTSKKIVLTD